MAQEPSSSVMRQLRSVARLLGERNRRSPDGHVQKAGSLRPLPDNAGGADLYLDLMKKCLTRFIFERTDAYNPELRLDGRDWPLEAETMVGLARLDNLEACIRRVLKDRVPGDLIETGVWRGGAAIFMRAALRAFGDSTRTVWAADSFAGLPRPDPGSYPADLDDATWQQTFLAVSLAEVKKNFERYGLLDEQVRFLVGWFRDTLPSAPIDRLAVLRLDGDMYESTMLALDSLYPKLSPGGYVIIDDYGAVPGCRAAVEDFRAANRITEPVEEIDWTGVFWRRSARQDSSSSATSEIVSMSRGRPA